MLPSELAIKTASNIFGWLDSIDNAGRQLQILVAGIWIIGWSNDVGSGQVAIMESFIFILFFKKKNNWKIAKMVPFISKIVLSPCWLNWSISVLFKILNYITLILNFTVDYALCKVSYQICYLLSGIKWIHFLNRIE